MMALARLCMVRARTTVALAGVLVALASAGLLRLESDNAVERYAPTSGAAAERLAAFRNRFDATQPLRIVLGGERLFTADGIAELERIERGARAIAGVSAVSSAAATARALLAADPALDPAELGRRSAEDPTARALGWVAPGGRVASALLELAPLRGTELRHRDTALDRLVASIDPALEPALVGGRALEQALDVSTREIERRFLPLLVLFAVALLAATFRDLAGVAVPLAFVVAVVGSVLGAMGWAGVELHLVLGVLPPLLFVIALATAVHLAIRHRALEAEGLEPIAATEATWREKGAAVLWTALAAAAGFAALAASDVRPVAELGRWATFGLGVQLLAAFTLYPALLALGSRAKRRLPERPFEQRLERLGRAVASRAVGRRTLVLALYASTAVAAALGLGRLGSSSDAVGYFAAEHPVRVRFERAHAAGLGSGALELEIVAPAPGELFAPQALTRLAALTGELARIEGVASVASLATLLDQIARDSPWAELSTPEELRAQGLEILAADEALAAARARFATPAGDALRIALFVPLGGFERLEPIALEAERRTRAAFPEAEVAATGLLRQVLSFHEALVGTLGRSLLLTLPVLAAVFWLLLGSARGVAKALVPNVWPVVVLLGGMGWLALPLDLATVMVASIVLGLVVDDTIHTLAHHREDAARLGAREAVTRRIEQTAPAYLLTGAILAAGFGVCALSDFEPIARFGALSAVAIVLAVVSDLLLVPALFGGEKGRE